MLKTYIPSSSSISFVVLMILLNTTTPATAGPFGILLVFLSGYIFSVGIISYALFGLTRVLAHLSMTFMSRKPYEPLSIKKSYYYSLIIASAPTMLLALQSVGSIGIYELILVVIFVTIGCLYISKRSM